MTSPDEPVGPDEAGATAPPDPEDRDFRRGNINFDFLPETHNRPRAIDESDRRGGRRRGKRGLFNRGRPVRSIGRTITALWSLGALLSVGAVVGLSVWDGPPFRVLFLPVPLFIGMWCLMMLLLFRARPS